MSSPISMSPMETVAPGDPVILTAANLHGGTQCVFLEFPSDRGRDEQSPDEMRPRVRDHEFSEQHQHDRRAAGEERP